jgi:hypothetical protein
MDTWVNIYSLIPFSQIVKTAPRAEEFVGTIRGHASMKGSAAGSCEQEEIMKNSSRASNVAFMV